MYRPIDLVGVGVEGGGTALESLLGVDARERGEDVTRLQIPPPAAQPVKAVFFLVEFGDGELADAPLLVDLDLELVALGDELGPLGGACGVELVQQPLVIGFAARAGV